MRVTAVRAFGVGHRRTSSQYIDRHPSGEKIFVRYDQGVLGNDRLGAREREVIARSDVLVAVVYSQIEGFFDSVMEASSPGLRAVDFGDLAGVTGGVEVVERYHGRFALGGSGGARRVAGPAVEVPAVVDTTGAGDTFAAGFLLEYCASRDVGRSLARGAQEAGAAVQRVGAFPWEDGD